MLCPVFMLLATVERETLLKIMLPAVEGMRGGEVIGFVRCGSSSHVRNELNGNNVLTLMEITMSISMSMKIQLGHCPCPNHVVQLKDWLRGRVCCVAVFV
eukprot:GHVN01097070.1.p1 GENE.GHVN01097070.1~~GHVN01097070.1.p1  ORF type:complete len:100 (+),score=14.12 GHVN01097070.1:62-361(+)